MPQVSDAEADRLLQTKGYINYSSHSRHSHLYLSSLHCRWYGEEISRR